ncbi:FIST C-terminal domain-containing protein [Geomonas sp. Red32]|uniref:FIST signal transduction protein n=1 Tax=Geomonas sp. Red32 TaxID=2912856 RepID=UPI00202CA706|nr:FIST C-terminal domain-containing protein [Geomonas sp. Red32]MCM0082569.1 FIST C-terminal domain-containing protein [Geomonas sp. Red32]
MTEHPQIGMQVFEQIATEEAGLLLESWQGSYPGMGILALVAEKEREQWVPQLQKLCNDRGVALCGAVFPALLAKDRFLDHGCILLRFDVMPFARIYEALEPYDRTAAETTARLAEEVTAHQERPRDSSLLLIFDAMVSHIATILDELYLKLADRVRYMGINAGSETFRPIPCLFDNNRTTQGGVLAILLTEHPGAVVEHCYLAPQRMISATSTEGNRIIAIDWRPAFDVYQEAAREEYGIDIDRDNFYQYAVHFPFGIIRANEEIVVRMPVAVEDDGSIFCVGEVPPNALLTLLRAPEVDSRQTVEKLAQGLATIYGSLAGANLLTFYCAGRRIHLGEAATGELAALFQRTGAARQAGALTLGEIGQSIQMGYPFFHNGALVCSRWGR